MPEGGDEMCGCSRTLQGSEADAPRHPSAQGSHGPRDCAGTVASSIRRDPVTVAAAGPFGTGKCVHVKASDQPVVVHGVYCRCCDLQNPSQGYG